MTVHAVTVASWRARRDACGPLVWVAGGAFRTWVGKLPGTHQPPAGWSAQEVSPDVEGAVEALHQLGPQSLQNCGS